MPRQEKSSTSTPLGWLLVEPLALDRKPSLIAVTEGDRPLVASSGDSISSPLATRHNISMVLPPPPQFPSCFDRLLGGGQLEKSKKQQSGPPKETGPKPVEQIDMKTGVVLRVFDTGADAARTFNISPNAISACCHGRRFSAAGFQWRFAHREPSETKTADRPTNHRAAPPEATRKVPPPPAVPGADEPVEQVDIASGVVLKVHSSIFEAARSLGVSSHVVLACCSGRRPYAGGYAWRYQQLSPSSSGTAPSSSSLPAPTPGLPVHSNAAPGFREPMRPLDPKRIFPTSMIEQLDLVSQQVVKEYTTCAEAARAAGLPINSITLCCLGRLNSAGGYHWRFKKFTQLPPRAVMPGPAGQRGPLNHALLADSRPPVPPPPPALPRVEPAEKVETEVTSPERSEPIEPKETAPSADVSDTTISLVVPVPELEPPVPESPAPPLIAEPPAPPFEELSVPVAVAPPPSPVPEAIPASPADFLVLDSLETVPALPDLVLSPRPGEDPPEEASPGRLHASPGPYPPLPLLTLSEPLPGAQEASGMVRHSNAGCEIEQVNPSTGEVIASHPSFRSAGKQLGIAPRAISQCVIGKRKIAGGFVWRYRAPPAPTHTTSPPQTHVPGDGAALSTDNPFPESTAGPSVTTQPESLPMKESGDQAAPISVVAAEEEVGRDDDRGVTSRSSRKRKSTEDLRLYEYTPPAARAPALLRRPTPEVKQPSSRPSNRPQPVQQVDLATGEVIATFQSRADAARSTGICSTNIAQCCSGAKPSVGGYGWRFRDPLCDLHGGGAASSREREGGEGEDRQQQSGGEEGERDVEAEIGEGMAES
jgi:hypothetical protein